MEEENDGLNYSLGFREPGKTSQQKELEQPEKEKFSPSRSVLDRSLNKDLSGLIKTPQGPTAQQAGTHILYVPH